IREVIRGVPLYYPFWLKVPKERKAALITDIRTQFDLRPHMESPNWTEINAGIQQHLQKAYNTNKAAFKAQHWVIDPTIGTYNVEKIRREDPENITASEWDKYIEFWNDPRNIARAAQNRQNREKSTAISRQGSRYLARLRDEMTSTTQEYPSLFDTFFVVHTVNGEFLRDEDRRIYPGIYSQYNSSKYHEYAFSLKISKKSYETETSIDGSDLDLEKCETNIVVHSSKWAAAPDLHRLASKFVTENVLIDKEIRNGV
nr:probable protein S-acyltransferase 7 [Tanacetum cinerariifolium]